MHVAVAGGTGVVGRLVVAELQRAGHETTVLARAAGVDLTSGDGLIEALKPADAVIDVANAPGSKRSVAIDFFQTSTANLLAAEADLGIGHHLALSIVGVGRVSFGYYDGKQRQEQLITAGPVPWTILPATQFHEFPAQLVAQVRGPVIPVPRMRSQPIAAREVAQHLLGLVEAGPTGYAAELAGPQVLEMPALTRQLLRARGSKRLVLPVRLPGRAGREMLGGGLLPITDGPRGRQTFAQWLQAETDAA